MNDDNVSWMSPAVPCRSTAITGSAGRYMSIDSGVKAESSASRTRRGGVRDGRVEVEVIGLADTGIGFRVPCYKRTMTSLPDLSETQIRRYARHIVLAEIGGIGQSKLIATKVLV